MFESERRDRSGSMDLPSKVGQMNKRQEEILQMVQQQGFVSIEALAQSFGVTTQTIRRDINSLCEQRLLTRYHGGAGPPSSAENVDYQARKVLNLEAKRRIAALVASHIPDRASLFINLGTTTEEVAKALMGHVGLRVITNNLNVAALLSDNLSFEVLVAGGVVRPRDRGITGEATLDFIRQFKVDFGIIGISSIDEDGSLLDFDYREVRVAQAIIENSRQLLLAADHSKFGRKAMVRLGHLAQIDGLYTDRLPPEALYDVLKEHHVALHVADTGMET